MKNDGKLGRNYLLDTLGDAINALLCGAGHNIRLILKKLREKLFLFFASLLFGACYCFTYRKATPLCLIRRFQNRKLSIRNSRRWTSATMFHVKHRGM